GPGVSRAQRYGVWPPRRALALPARRGPDPPCHVPPWSGLSLQLRESDRRRRDGGLLRPRRLPQEGVGHLQDRRPATTAPGASALTSDQHVLEELAGPAPRTPVDVPPVAAFET